MNTPIGLDPLFLELGVNLKKIVKRPVCVTDVVYADGIVLIGLRTVRHEKVQIRERETVMLVVVSQKSKRGILMLHPCAENGFVPLEHFFKTTGSINDMSKLARAN
jgi:hypothetical protein